MSPRTWFAAAAGLLISTLGFGPASAAILDLIPPPASGTLSTDSDGAAGTIYSTTELQPTGTGVIRPFVRINGSSSPQDAITEGYNTDHRPVQFDEKHDHQYTHSFPLGDLTPLSLQGIDYHVFLLDANQTGSDPALSMDRLQIYLGDTRDLHDFTYAPNGGTFSGAASLVYSLDTSASDNRIDIPVQNTNGFDANTGSGSGDLYVYVPVSEFSGKSGSWVYLYSLFGTEGGQPAGFRQNGGFEEWAARDQPPGQVPGPSALVLLGVTLLTSWGYRHLTRRL